MIEPESLLAHADFVRALTRRLVEDETRADDVVQEVWLSALQNPPRAARALRSWLAAVIRNAVINSRRDDERRIRREHAAARWEGVDSTARIVEWESNRRRVVEAVLDLDAPYRTVIVLRYYDDLPPRDIATRLELPVETVKTRLKRALAMVRSRLDQEFARESRSWCLVLASLAGLEKGTAAAATSSILPGVIAMSSKTTAGLAAVLLLGSIVAYLVLNIDRNGDRFPPTTTPTDQMEASHEPADSPVDQPSSEEQADLSNRPADSIRGSIAKVASRAMTVYGCVKNEAGHPLEGVVINETWSEVSRFFGSFQETPWNDTGHRTGADGRFELYVPLDRLPLTSLGFQHPEYAALCVPLISAVTDYSNRFYLNEVRLVAAPHNLEHHIQIAGMVTDVNGDPVAGCAVCAPGVPWDTGAEAARTRVITDEGGRFRLSLSKKESVRVTAYVEEIGTGWSRYVVPGRDLDLPEVTIVLERGLPIAGRLSRSDGSPGAGTRLYVEGEIQGFGVRKVTVCDEQGRFCFPCLPITAYRVETVPLGLSANEPIGDDVRYMVLSDAVYPGTESLHLHLPQGSQIVVYLSDHEGKPLEREPELGFIQYLELEPGHTDYHDYSWAGELTSPAPGTFVLDDVQHGTYGMFVKVAGFERERLQIEVPEAPDLSEIYLDLHPVRSISGYVFKSDGTPARGFAVQAEKYHTPASLRLDHSVSFNEHGVRTRYHSWMSQVVVIDETGFFCIEEVAAGENLLCCLLEGREVYRQRSVIVTDEAPHAEVSITLPVLSGSIEGVVRDSTGKPLDGALVLAWNGDQLLNAARSDARGRYGFFNMPDGSYVVDARCLAAAALRVRSSPITQPTRDRPEDLEAMGAFNAVIRQGDTCRLDLTIADPWNSQIAGQVRSGSGRLPAGFNVSLRSILDPNDQSTSRYPSMADLFRPMRHNRDSRYAHFRFENLPAARYKVNVSWNVEAGESKRREIESDPIFLQPSSTHTLDVHIALASLQGAVFDRATGEPITGARVILSQRTNGDEIELDVDDHGRFEGVDLPAGDYRLVVYHPGYAIFIDSLIDLPENAHIRDLECDLEVGCSAAGWLRLADGASLDEHWRIVPVIDPIGACRYGGADIATDGSFLLQSLPQGPLTLYVYHRRKRVLETSVTLPLPVEKTLVIEVAVPPN